MTVYPASILRHLESLAATAADERRRALRAIQEGLAGDHGTVAADVRRGMKGLSEDQVRWAQRFLCEQFVLPSENRPRLDLEFVKLLILWLRRVQSGLKLQLTPDAEKESVSPVDRELADVVAAYIAQSISHERAARSAIGELFTASYACRWANGSACNPMRETARMVLLKNNSKHRWLKNPDNNAIDELMTAGFEALTNRIDQFDPAKGAFLAWWYTLLFNLLRDRMRKAKRTKEETNQDASYLDDRFEIRPVWDEDLFSQSFSDADWSVIQGWKEFAVDIPVVLIVGFDWVQKIRRKDEHGSEFCQWLIEYGVSDPEGFVSDLASAPESTEERFKVLEKSGIKSMNAISTKFSRPFAGIHQSAKQTSFGKKHHAIELEFFWKLEWVVGRHASQETCAKLNQMEPGPRVTALSCTPAWHLLGGRAEWVAEQSGWQRQRNIRS